MFHIFYFMIDNKDNKSLHISLFKTPFLFESSKYIFYFNIMYKKSMYHDLFIISK